MLVRVKVWDGRGTAKFIATPPKSHVFMARLLAYVHMPAHELWHISKRYVRSWFSSLKALKVLREWLGELSVSMREMLGHALLGYLLEKLHPVVGFDIDKSTTGNITSYATLGVRPTGHPCSSW